MTPAYTDWAQTFERLLAQHRAVTILSHVAPDADAIGTALGMSQWLQERGIRTEVVNASNDVPHNLDFLDGFARIKSKMDFDDALVIACDCSAADRLGFDVSKRTVMVIDHHHTNTRFGTLNIVDSDAVASSEVAYRLVTRLHPVSAKSATAFYAALISDTRNFTTQNMHPAVLKLASDLAACGVDIPHTTSQMYRRRSLASLRILGAAIDSLELKRDARVAIMTIRQADQVRWGAQGSDLDGIVDDARALVTVHIAILLVVRKTDIKVSLRSTGADVSRIAGYFGGGGHREAAGFEVQGLERDGLVAEILMYIDTEDLLA